MKDMLNPNDFQVITTPFNNSSILFYTPNTQLYSLTDPGIKEYLDICSNRKTPESTFLSHQEIVEINNFLKRKFRLSLPSTILKTSPKTEFKSLILPVSGKCNLRCTYCFASVNGQFAFNDISTIESKKIIDYLLLSLGLNELEITFFGGEPLLNLKTIKFVIMYINEVYPEKQIRYSITTNGTIFNKTLLGIIKANNISVLISIDGPKEITNHRIDSTGKSSFDKAIKTINRLQAEGVVVHLRATLTSDVNNLVEVYAFFEKLGIPFKIVFAHDSENKNYNLANYNESLEMIEKQLNSLILYYIELIGRNGKISCDSINEKLKFLLYRTKNYHACTGGRSMFSITSDGEIYSCEHLAGYKKYSVGNINKGINKNKLNSLRTTSVENIEECKQCWLRYFCAGGCFSNNITSTSDVRKPEKNRCDLIKIEHKFFITLYFEINKIYPEFFQIRKTLTE